MDISPLSSNPSVRAAMLAAQTSATAQPTSAQLDADRRALAESLGVKAPGQPAPAATAADIKKAASQFEAIIIRQLLGPSLEPLMSGGLGGSQNSGGGMYGYMLTDVMASSLAQGGGLGWASLLEKQLSPAPAGADNLSSASTF